MLTYLLNVLCIGIVVKVVSSQCPATFQLQHGDSCYKIMGLNATWIEAKQYCQVMGSDLAVIENADEEKFIEGELQKIHNTTKVGPENYWIDGADFLDGVWRWMRTDGGSYLITGYTNWSPGQPDALPEHCLEIRYSFGITWNNYLCDKRENFICEARQVLHGITTCVIKGKTSSVKRGKS